MDYSIRMRAYNPRTGPFSRLHHAPIFAIQLHERFDPPAPRARARVRSARRPDSRDLPVHEGDEGAIGAPTPRANCTKKDAQRGGIQRVQLLEPGYSTSGLAVVVCGRRGAASSTTYR